MRETVNNDPIRLMEKKEGERTIRFFAAASFLNDFGSDIIYPLWPLFVTSVMGANMAVLGFIDGLGDALVSLSSAASGYVSDKARRRKVFIWVGYLFGSMSRIGYALATVWQHLIPLRVLDRMGKIRSAPRDAIIADISTDQNRGNNFGVLRMMDNLGAVCGITVAIVFFDSGLRTLFMFAAIPSMIAVLLVLFFIKERPAAEMKMFKGLSFTDLDRNFWVFLILSSLFALGTFSYSFLLLYAKAFGIKQSVLPALYLIFTGAAALCSLPFGRFSDIIGRKSVLMLSYGLWALVCAVFLLGRSFSVMIFGFIVYGLHKGALETVQKAFVAELSPVAYRASTLGGYQMVIGLCAFPASLAAGVLWNSIDMNIPLYVSLTLTVISIVMLMFVKEKKR
jgi:MFS family permease